ERQISAHGWTGYGYTIVDPETGAGAYLIEGKGNGGYLDRWADGYGNGVAFALFVVSFIAAAAGVAGTLVGILAVIGVFVAIMNLMTIRLAAIEGGCGANSANFFLAIEIIALALSVIPALGAGGVALGAFLSFISGNSFTSAAPACRNLSR
ncbi:MAG: transglutaminase, partial [Burkholderiales bacterium]|nr:transglutaminase [Burkholderiales bacterium]